MAFRFQPFSRRQRQLLNWWRPGSGHEHQHIVLADGAIRSGKTVAMILSFFLWSQSCHEGREFIVAGVTAGALKRNVLLPLFSMLEALGVPYEWKRSEGMVTVGKNRYFLFGADKDNAQDKLQGMTAAGAYADEAALFPRSFIDQMIGRCSVAGSRIFMNCNPNGAYHFIKTDFIDRADEIGLYRLHFTMDDNLTLSPEIRENYARSFAGVFYRQYILGEWVSAEGAVYPMWDDRENTFSAAEGDGDEPFEVHADVVGAVLGPGGVYQDVDAGNDGQRLRVPDVAYIMGIPGVGHGGVSYVDPGDIMAGIEELPRDGAPDTARGACDQHPVFLLFCFSFVSHFWAFAAFSPLFRAI